MPALSGVRRLATLRAAEAVDRLAGAVTFRPVTGRRIVRAIVRVLRARRVETLEGGWWYPPVIFVELAASAVDPWPALFGPAACAAVAQAAAVVLADEGGAPEVAVVFERHPGLGSGFRISTPALAGLAQSDLRDAAVGRSTPGGEAADLDALWRQLDRVGSVEHLAALSGLAADAVASSRAVREAAMGRGAGSPSGGEVATAAHLASVISRSLVSR